MTGRSLIWLILIINVILTLIYFCYVRIVKKQKYGLEFAVMMLLCPVVGIFCVFGAQVMSLFFREKELDYEHLSFRKDKRESVKPVDPEAGYYAAPFEDVLKLSRNSEKRLALLRILKKDRRRTIPYITDALWDKDTETSHYAASAVLSYIQEQGEQIAVMKKEYEDGGKQPEQARRLAQHIRNYLDSGVLSKWEKIGYERMVCDIMAGVVKDSGVKTCSADYKLLIHGEYNLKEYEEALKWAVLYQGKFPEEESAYLELLPIYYTLHRTEEFFDTLERLKKLDIVLSREALVQVRFWSNLQRGADA